MEDGPRGRNRRIVLYGNPVLRTRSRSIPDIARDTMQFLADLKATMMAQDGLGLAANQIGEPIAAFAVNPHSADTDRPPYCVINPEITAAEGKVEREEGCLSLPGVYDVVSRPELVRIAGIDESGRPVEVEATGLLARTFAHEIDHLNGVLFIDHLSPQRRKMLEARLKELEERERAACG